MSLDEAKRQMSEPSELASAVTGEARPNPRSGEASSAAQGAERSGIDYLMERVVERSNVVAALRRVQQIHIALPTSVYDRLGVPRLAA
jgi:hypothetical protein